MPVDQPTVDALRERAERLRQQVERATGAYQLITGEMKTMEVTAVSGDRLVTATVGADGKLRRLLLDPGIYHDPDADQLARTIEETIEVAARGAQERMLELCKPYLPEDVLEAYLTQDPDRMVQGLAGGFSEWYRER